MKLTLNATGGTVTAPSGLTVFGKVTVTAGSRINGSIIVSVRGQLTLEDNVAVVSQANEDDAAGAVVLTGGSVTVGSGAHITSAYGGGITVMALLGDCRLTVGSGAQIEGELYGLGVGTGGFDAVAELNGCTVTGSEAAVYAVGEAELTVNGGTYTGGQYGLYAAGDDVDIKGGAFTGTEKDGLVVGDGFLYLSGGTFTGGQYAIECLTEDDDGAPIQDPFSLRELLDAGCGYIGEDDQAVTVQRDQMTLAGPVSVGPVAALVRTGETVGYYISLDQAWAGANAARGDAVALELTTSATAAGTLRVDDGAKFRLRIGGTLTANIDIGSPEASGTGELILSQGAVMGQVSVYGGALTVNGAELASALTALRITGGAVTLENNAIVQGDVCGVAVEDGKLTVSTANIAGDGTYGIFVGNGQVVMDDGAVAGAEAGICVEGGAFTISDGIVGGETGLLVRERNEAVPVSVEVSGGAFWGSEGPGLMAESTSASSLVRLSGGRYTGVPNAIESGSAALEKLLAADRGYFDADGGRIAPAADQTALAGYAAVQSMAPLAEVTVNGTATRYTAFDKAWAAAVEASAARIDVLRDVTVEDELEIVTGGRVIFRGGQYTLTAEEGICLGDVANGSEWDRTMTGNALVLESGTLRSYISLYGGNLTVNGGSIEADKGGSAVTNLSGTVTVNGGSIVSGQFAAVSVYPTDPDDLLTVNGGELRGAVRGVEVCGEVRINGGTIVGGEDGIHANGSKDCLAVIAIAGGQIAGTDGRGLCVAENCSVAVTGGTFQGDVNAVECITADHLYGSPIEQKLTVNDLLTAGYGWFDSAGAAIAPAKDQLTLSGAVSVRALTPPATPAVTATAAPTAAPTATPVVTATAAPTATPAVTATAAPTATPAVTATAAPTATAPAAPATGDGAAILPWAGMLLGCGGLLAAVTVLRRKERGK